MRSDLIQKASQVITDTPLLINMVSQRVRQLNQGRAPLVNTGGSRMGVADIALMEIIEGKVVQDVSEPDKV
ncbi:MAG: DNA-directed RNA polymerase subunit omega [Verrucomicrobiales bacterium]|jgi:DNA-directed RNA polymerase subunit omega